MGKAQRAKRRAAQQQKMSQEAANSEETAATEVAAGAVQYSPKVTTESGEPELDAPPPPPKAEAPPDAFDETDAVSEAAPRPRPIARQPGTTTTMLKCVVLGSSNVGKSSLLERYTKNSFKPERRVTLGADFASKVIELGQERVRLIIWDTAGQERFHHGTIGGAFYRGADGALLVYDTADFSTFAQVELWRRELLQRVDGPDAFPIVCVGNKMDLPCPTRAEDSRAAGDWCRAHGIGLVFASACDGTGVGVAMEAVAALALENKRTREAAGLDTKPPSLSLDELHAREKRAAGCCA
jgi:small GTP-binding protein